MTAELLFAASRRLTWLKINRCTAQSRKMRDMYASLGFGRPDWVCVFANAT